MKLWDKGIHTAEGIDRFTVGNDRDWDKHLAPWDVIGSLAHARMLQSCGLISETSGMALQEGLRKLLPEVQSEDFSIGQDYEDIHSWVEFQLTASLGDPGKELHTARSRNDQVLLDIKLFLREEVRQLCQLTEELSSLLLAKAESHKDILLPGYTHLQVAMPSSFGLWFSAWAECLADDLLLLKAAYDTVNQNPLGSAAGYGSSFPIDRSQTTELLGFESMHYNVVAAQLSRGKTELHLGMALAAFGNTLSRLAMDVCLYCSQNFNFLKLPAAYTTGSSIMPHKQNPDVFELIRGKAQRLGAIPQELLLLGNGLPSGYHREFQLSKDILFPGLLALKDCLEMSTAALREVEVNAVVSPDDERYRYLFTVDSINEEVKQGASFRDAYRSVGKAVQEGSYSPPESPQHSHEGSLGNLCLPEIKAKVAQRIAAFDFGVWQEAVEGLVKG